MNPTMPATVVKSVEQFAIDGPIGSAAAIAMGLAIALSFAWMLRREAGVLGLRTAALFWMLRTVALVVVVWMLLAPTTVRVETSTTRRAIAIVTDVSGSMQTVDPAGASDDLRWDISRAGSPDTTATRAADSAVAALGVAERQLVAASEALRQHRREALVLESVSAADAAIARTREHLQSLSKTTSNDSLADRLLKTLDDPEFQSFAQLSRALQKGRTPPQKGWRESLPDLAHRVAGIKSSLQELARRVADEESQRWMRDNSAPQNASRTTRGADWLDRLQPSLRSVRDKADVRVATFDRSLLWLSNQPSPGAPPNQYPGTGESPSAAAGTDLSAVFGALQREQQERPLAAIFLLSDFAHNQPGEKSPQDAAATLGSVPVYAVPIGNSQHVRDIQLQSVFAPTVAMRNDDIVIEANLQAFDCAGEVCTVQLMQGGQVIDQREVVLDSDYASRTVRFEQQVPTVGTQSFRVALAPVEGELTEENNDRDFEVNVTRSDIKLLLADELPRWEYRYLAQLFRRDPKVECDELLFRPRVIATGRREATRTFPVTADEWDQYDVVLLGDVSTEHLPAAAQESLIAYLQQRGGTLFIVAGHEAMPHAYADHLLADVLPVLPVENAGPSNVASYTFRVTEEGHNHQALMIGESEEASRTAWDFVNQYSPLPSVSLWRQPRASAHSLIAAIPNSSRDEHADAQHSVFLCWQPVGRGRVVYLSAPETFRLRYLRGDRLHYRFWGQLLRWAIAADLSSGSKFVRIRTDKSRYEMREAIAITVRLTNADGEPVVAEDVAARVTSSDNERTVHLMADPQVPGEYATELRALPPGAYRIEPIGPAVEQLRQNDAPESVSSSFTVQSDVSAELTDTRCDRALAQQIADVTGGQVLPPTAVEEILRLTNLEPEVSEKIERRPLWLQWKYLWIVFGCLQTEWIVRKWMGLS